MHTKRKSKELTRKKPVRWRMYCIWEERNDLRLYTVHQPGHEPMANRFKHRLHSAVTTAAPHYRCTDCHPDKAQILTLYILIVMLCISIVTFMYSYCYLCFVLCILSHCVVLYTVCV
jgi:hypothetical protein